jgi:hypothetical protein
MGDLARTLFAVLLVAGALAPTPALAQPARARVRAGDVTGLEMGLEGALSAPRGGQLRWLVTTYEVLGLAELRPASDVRVHVSTSLQQARDALEVSSDAMGRATVELPIPADAPPSFRVVLRLVNPAGVQRRFELTVRTADADALEVHLADPRLLPGGPARVFGRVVDARSGRPRAGATVRLALRDGAGRPVGAEVPVETDAAGLFAHAFPVPADLRGALRVQARAGTDEHPVRADATCVVAEPVGPPLVVAIAPARTLVSPGAAVPVEVVVRTAQGRPVEGALVTVDGTSPRETGRRAQTDARGHAQLTWTAPGTGDVADAQVRVTAVREGFGSATEAARVRVAALEHAAGLAVEGGGLSPELGGRVWVRVVGADGRPAAAGVPVRLEGPRLPAAGLTGATDADGVATFDLRLGPPTDPTADRCGGQSATALEVRVGARTTLSPCLPLDPDAAARVRLQRPVAVAGSPLELTVDRVRATERAPVELSLLDPSRGARALAQVVLPAGESQARIELPQDVGGLVWVRARPLIGDRREVVRGGVAVVWVRPGRPFAVQGELGPDGTLRTRLSGAQEARAYVVAAPIDAARELARTLRASALGPFADLRRDPSAVGDALLFGALAAATPADAGAPAVLRGARIVPVPDPEEPTQVGLLRDPWRTRARFVTGRLALVFHALEQYVSEALPERVDDVAVRGPRGFELNGQILESVAASGSLGPAGATGLGGEPLGIEQLRRFDPSLTYDNVARRITRERLFRLLLALRTFTQARGFDLPWSRLGDPSGWLRQLVGQHVPGLGQLDRRQMVDGWGRPFQLVPARGGRSRFTFVDPLGAWELVSAGPDGRVGTGDDQWDPTARVLRSGTPYAEAVGEDVLVARLSGVELGRASLELWTRVEPAAARVGPLPRASGAATQLGRALWTTLPRVFEPELEPLALRRPAHPGRSVGGERVDLGPSGALELPLDEEPRTWGAVIYAWSPDGWGSVDLSTARGGAPLLVEGGVPHHLRVGEPVTLDLVLTNLRDEPVTVQAEGEGEGFEVTAPEPVRLGAGEAGTLPLRVAPASTPGRGRVTLRLVDTAPLRRLEWRPERVTGRHPMRSRAAGLARADRPFVATLSAPADAARAVGRVVIFAPSALGADPDLAELRRRDPALVAWSHALAGRRPDPTLWARLLRAQQADGLVDGPEPALSSACALVALATVGEHDDAGRAALARLRASFRRLGVDESRSQAALLAAVASSGVPELTNATDPVLQVAAATRARLRQVLRTHPGEQSLLARAAAALLLADPQDAYGRAMLERAEAALQDAPNGGARLRPSEGRQAEPAEEVASTFALAVAAHQAGRAELAQRLLQGGLGREHVALRRGGEAAFWLLAAGAYGALGTGPEAVTVVVDGRRHVVTLEQGRAVVPLAEGLGPHSVVVEVPEHGQAMVRAELVYERPFQAAAGRSLALELGGDVGEASGVAALELSVRALRALNSPVVELALPAGVDADDALLGALRASPHVLAAERREAGFVRLRLRPMATGTEAVLPLPLRWSVRGTVRGLGAVGYPQDDPADMTTLAPRELQLREELGSRPRTERP